MSDSESKPRKYGLSIFREGLEEWIDTELVPRPYPWLGELEKKAKEDKFPVLTPASGAVLSFLVSSWNPKIVLELGTGYGVSLVWMYSALSSDSGIQSVDREILFSETTRSFLKRIPGSEKNIELFTGECVELLQNFLDSPPNPNKEFVFVDCDKVKYPEIFRMLVTKGSKRKLRVVFDNVLWHGRIADPVQQAPSDQAIRDLWLELKNSGLHYTLFPVGDGILCFDFLE